MLRKTVSKIFSNPLIFNIVRRILEDNFRGEKRAIRRELGKNYGKILDVPCGTGEFSVMFNQESYFGIDISEKYVNYAKKTYSKNFHVMNATNLKFESKSFDSVLIIGFFHHLDLNEISPILNEINRVLKDNGKLLLIEDAPTKSKINLIGKLVQKYDLGANIRKADIYRDLLSKKFKIDKYYPIRSGVCDYSVFSLSKK